MKVTVKHVAERVGCSPSLVYFYLNHPGTTRVAAATRKKIDEAVRELDYRPNLPASILKNGSGRIIGVMIDTEAPDLVKKILTFLEQEITGRGFYLQVGMFHNNFESLCSSYFLLKQFGARGVICLSHDYPEFRAELDAFFAEHADIVFYNGPSRPGHPLLEVDLPEGIARLWEHLMQRGMSRLMLCLKDGCTESFGIQRRVSGYRRVVQKKCLPICCFDPSLPLHRNFAETLLPLLEAEKPQAVLFSNDGVALSAMQFLQVNGIKIPEELSIIGFDNDAQGENSTPALTTIAVDIPAAAKQLTDLLFEQLEHNNPPRCPVISPKLFFRGSCR